MEDWPEDNRDPEKPDENPKDKVSKIDVENNEDHT
jgi:hypothetical protein